MNKAVIRVNYEDGGYQGVAARHALELAEKISSQLPDSVRSDDATSILISAGCDSFVFSMMMAIEGMDPSVDLDNLRDSGRLGRMHEEMLKDVIPFVQLWVLRRMQERKEEEQ